MPRVKTGIVRRKRHKKVLKEAKGYRGAILADLALNNPAEFAKLVEKVK